VLLEQLLSTVAQDSAPAAERPERGPSLASYLGAVRRRWKPMLLIFLLATAAVAWKLKPGASSYVTTATMLLPSSGASGGADAAAAMLGARRDAPGGAIDTQIAIVQSPKLVARAKAIAKLRLARAKKPTKNVDDVTIRAAAPVSPELIDITVTAPDPDSATYVANAAVQAYSERTSSAGNEIHEANLQFVSSQVREVNSRLQSAKRELQRFKDQNKVFSIETELTRSSQQISELEAKARAARYDAEAGATGPTIASDGITTSLQQKAADARLKYETVLRDFYETSPEALAAKNEWQNAQAQVDKRVRTLMNQTQQFARDAQRELDEARRNASVLPAVEFRLSQLNQKVAQLEDLYKTLSDRYNTLMLTRNAKTATPSNLTPAEQVVEANRTWTRAALMGLLVGYRAGAGLHGVTGTNRYLAAFDRRSGAVVAGHCAGVDAFIKRQRRAPSRPYYRGATHRTFAVGVVPHCALQSRLRHHGSAGAFGSGDQCRSRRRQVAFRLEYGDGDGVRWAACGAARLRFAPSFTAHLEWPGTGTRLHQCAVERSEAGRRVAKYFHGEFASHHRWHLAAEPAGTVGQSRRARPPAHFDRAVRYCDYR
jgi:uncharacterized protein involved in exopolysaccharide biosynthesis